MVWGDLRNPESVTSVAGLLLGCGGAGGGVGGGIGTGGCGLVVFVIDFVTADAYGASFCSIQSTL